MIFIVLSLFSPLQNKFKAMNLLIALDIIFFIIMIKFFRDILNSTKKIKENKEQIVQTLKDKEKYPNLK